MVVYKDKIYVACGITDGHYDGHVAWLDKYDPKMDTWKRLPDAPRTRDHISAAVVDDKIYLAGGRNSTARINKVLETTIAEVDVCDFKTNRWTTKTTLNQGRHGTQAVVYMGNIYIVAGSANHGGGPELNTVEVMK